MIRKSLLSFCSEWVYRRLREAYARTMRQELDSANTPAQARDFKRKSKSPAVNPNTVSFDGVKASTRRSSPETHVIRVTPRHSLDDY